MVRRGLLKLVLIFVMLLFSNSLFAGAWPEDIEKKVNELHELAKNKQDMPPSLPGITVISGEKAYELWKSKKAIFLDNRVKTQYDTEKIPGAVWFFTDDLLNKGPEFAKQLDKNKEYVLYCNGIKCWRSPATAIMLHYLGYKIYWYREGLPDWKKRGYPTE